MISIGKASLINAVAKYSLVILNLIFTAILARLLSPEDYGIVAITTVFSVFFSLFTDVGLGAGVVQNQKLTLDNINQIFSFNTFIAIALAGLFCLAAFPISAFYEIPVLKPICYLLSISLFFNTMNSIPNAVLMKRQQFFTVGIRTIIVRFVTGIMTVILAFLGLKYYALVLQTIMASALIFLWNMVSTRLRFTFHIHRESFEGIKSFSFWQFCDKFVNYFSRNTDHFLIGKFLGQVPLGFYDKSYKLMLYPVQNFTHVISPVLHPILAVHQNDRNYIYRKYLKIMKILSLFGIYITAICFFCNREAILIVFGDGWSDSITCFKILSLAIWAQMTTASTGAIFQSLGETKKMFVATLLSSVVMVILTIIGLQYKSLSAVSVAVVVALNMSFILNYYVLMKYGFHISFFRLLAFLLPDFIILALIWVVMSFIHITINNLFFSAVAKSAVMTALFLVGMVVTGQGYLIMAVLRRITGKLRCRMAAKHFRNMAVKTVLPDRKTGEKRVIVSLTSFPDRFSTLDICLKSLFAQSWLPDKIILYLGKDSDGIDLPERVRELLKFGLEVKRGYADVRPHKKYLYAMQEYPDDIIITADDDLMYDRNLIRDLLKSYKKHPESVSARRVHRMTSKGGVLQSYNDFEKSCKKVKEPSHSLLSTNGAGSLFPPHSLPPEAFDEKRIKELCLNADDIWIKFMLIKNKVPVVWTASRYIMPLEIPNTQKNALCKENNSRQDSNNDRSIRNMEEFYKVSLVEYSYKL